MVLVEFGHFRSKCGRTRPKFARLQTNFARFRAAAGRFGTKPNLVDLGTLLAMSKPMWPKPGPNRPMLVKSDSNLGIVSPRSTQFDRSRPPIRPSPTRLRPNLGEVARFRAGRACVPGNLAGPRSGKLEQQTNTQTRQTRYCYKWLNAHPPIKPRQSRACTHD